MTSTPENSRQKYDVHLYPVAIITVRGVEADSQRAAGCIACGQMRDELMRRFGRVQVDFDGEFAGFLVDVPGDIEFAQSQFIYNEENPLLVLLQRFVAWHDSEGADPSQLAQLLAETREVIEHSA
jgi:hypothetical protein